MKKKNSLRSFLALVLVFAMMLGTCSTAFAGFTESPVSYVSLGDSMANGYGLAGYQPAEGNVNGYRQEAPDAYPAQVASEKGWDLTQLAISAMRAEDLNFILNFDWENTEQVELVKESQDWNKDDFITNKSRWDETFGCGDLYTWDEFVAGRFNDYAKVNPAESGTEEYAKMFQNSVAAADYVSMGIGNANFGVFLLGRITNAFGVLGGNSASDAWIDFRDALVKLDAPEQEAVMEVYNKLTAYLTQQSYIAVEQAELLANTVAYAVASYMLNYAEVVDRIVELNPDVNIILVGLMNTMSGSKMDFWGNEVDLGDILDIVINSMNTYIAALPSGMKLTGNYTDATFYYADEPHVEMIVNTLDDAWTASWTGDGYKVIRERLVEDICDGMVFEMVAPLFSGQGVTLDTDLTVEEIEDYEDSGEDAFSAYAPDAQTIANKVVSCQVYLAFEEAIIESTQIETMDAQAIFSLADSAKLNAVFAEIGAQVALTDLRGTLTTALTSNSTMKGLLNLFARHIIGNGIGSHPSAVGHDALTEAVLNTLENEYTTDDKIIDNIKVVYEDVKDIILEYYDEAYAGAYKELDKNGYVDAAANGIEGAIEAIKTIDISGTQMTDEFKAELAEELAAVVVTLTEIKSVLESDTAKDADGLLVAVAELEDDLWLHLANAGAILGQAGYDVKTLVGSIVDAYIEAIRAEMSAEMKKISHKKYEADEDSYYVAIGGDTVRATNIGRDEKTYYDLLAEELNVGKKVVTDTDVLLPSEVLGLIEANAEEIEKADFITYQADASSFIYAILAETPDWNRYIDAETQAMMSEIIAQTTEILVADWTEYADLAISEIVPEIKKAVTENLPKEIAFNEDMFDALAETCVTYVKEAVAVAENKKDEAIAEIEDIDETILGIAENLAYACVAYAVDTIKAVEAIEAINPDATLVVVGMYNPIRGLCIETGDKVIDAGEAFEYVIDATNLYYLTYAAENGNFAFVDASDANTNGFEEVIDISAMAINDISNIILGAENKMNANSDGHEYIKEQIIKSFVCDYSVYEQLNDKKHIVKCSLCGDAKEEAHSFANKVCTKCGYEKRSNGGFGGGGGAVANEFTIRFETNGGSEVESVTVKRGERLAAPTSPTKQGFVFDGWYTDKNLTSKYDFSQPVTKSFTLYAKWIFKLNFIDVHEGAWYYDVVKEAVEKGLMNGISATEFAPDASLTRGMFVTVLYRAAGEPGVTSLKSFADVPANQYYANAVAWASANGIVNGVSADKFDPNASITREQMAAIIYRFGTMTQIKVETDNEISYTDADSISPYAEEAAKWAYNAGVILGNADGSFAPQRTATRAEAAAIFVRLLAVIQ